MVMGYAFPRCDIVASQRGQELLNTDSAKFTALRAVTRRQAVKTQKTEKT
jgi:hypothetical protein